MIRLNVKGLKEERGRQDHHDLDVSLPELNSSEGQVSFAGTADIHVDITNTGLCLLITGVIDTSVNTKCARCLASFKYPVHADLFETYYDKEKGLSQNAEEGEDYVPYSGDEIDIQPEVLKAIILAMPIRALCSEQCKGLCPQCGCNRNVKECDCREEIVDSRMAKLKELLKRGENNGGS